MTIIIALLLFGAIVFIHELGHFLLARKNGVKIHEFSIGMGPKIYSFKKEVEYSIRLLPLGGFVSMEGEDDDSKDPRAFGNKSILQRASILFAGPFFNILLTLLLFIIIFTSKGFPSETTVLGQVVENSPAQIAGIKSGDKITAIDGNKVNNWNELVEKITTSNGKDVKVSISNNEKSKDVNIKPQLSEDGRYTIGIQQKTEKNIIKSITYSFKMTGDMINQMFKFIGQLITGTVPGGAGNAVAGPIGVISLASNAAKQGVINLLYFAAIISLNLGILNLLPIPALDGGRLFMLLIEFVRGGKKIDPNKEATLNLIGFGALMLLMLFTTYKDILKLF